MRYRWLPIVVACPLLAAAGFAARVWFTGAPVGNAAPAALTGGCGLWRVQLISDTDFESVDQLHYEVENKLLALITSVEAKRVAGGWQDSLPTHP